ncbi:hypothetical protein N9039_02225 [Verrucomicrobiales bacterium]|nr:hypothetical protein [Verrucomicrobiales bacterium]
MKLGRDPSDPARKNTTCFCGKFGQQVRIFKGHTSWREVQTAPRHLAIRAAEIGEAFPILWFHDVGGK